MCSEGADEHLFDVHHFSIKNNQWPLRCLGRRQIKMINHSSATKSRRSEWFVARLLELYQKSLSSVPLVFALCALHQRPICIFMCAPPCVSLIYIFSLCNSSLQIIKRLTNERTNEWSVSSAREEPFEWLLILITRVFHANQAAAARALYLSRCLTRLFLVHFKSTSYLNAAQSEKYKKGRAKMSSLLVFSHSVPHWRPWWKRMRFFYCFLHLIQFADAVRWPFSPALDARFSSHQQQLPKTIWIIHMKHQQLLFRIMIARKKAKLLLT